MGHLEPRLGQLVARVMSDEEEVYGRVIAIIKRTGTFEGHTYIRGELVIKTTDGRTTVYHRSWVRPHVTKKGILAGDKSYFQPIWSKD